MEKGKNNIKIALHSLQSVPASCLNRDDAGMPKTCPFGGDEQLRARVSSQCQKYARRKFVREHLSKEKQAERTREGIQMIVDSIMKIDSSCDSEKAEKEAVKAFDSIGIKNKDDKTDALVFMSYKQAEALAKLIVNGEKDKKKYQKAFNDHPSADQIADGRMIAGYPEYQYDHAICVSHAISTNEISIEYDYATAEDGLNKKGAANIRDDAFIPNAVYYWMECIDVNEFLKYFDVDETVKYIQLYVEAFFKTMPSGKNGSFFAQTPRDWNYIEMLDSQPYNFSNAFIKPIEAGEKDLIEASKDALTSYIVKVYQAYEIHPLHTYLNEIERTTFNLGCETMAFNEMLTAMGEDLKKELRNSSSSDLRR